MLEGFFSCDALARIKLEAHSNQVDQLRVLLDPVLLEVGYSIYDLWKIQVLDLFGLVADCHLIEADSVGPHVHSWSDMHTTGHLGGLVVLRAD